MIRPYPKAPARKVTSGKRPRSGKSRILTDTPVKAEIEQERSKKRKSTGNSASASAKRCLYSAARRTRNKKASKSSRKSHADDVPCLYCGEMWSTSDEQWIMCEGRCAEWAHVSCAGVGKKDIHFTCERC